MGRMIEMMACAGLCLIMGWSVVGPQPISTTPALTSLPLSGTPIPVAAAADSMRPATPTPCPDPMAIMKALYDANDASRFEASLAFFTEDPTLAMWAEGVNGYHMRERHLTGRAEIRPILGDPGLRRASDRPGGPIYHEARAKVSGDRVMFMLEPDRVRPNGKPYNPYRVEAVFAGCKIKSLTVIESVTWL